MSDAFSGYTLSYDTAFLFTYHEILKWKSSQYHVERESLNQTIMFYVIKGEYIKNIDEYYFTIFTLSQYCIKDLNIFANK